jgi:hypothetical protein
MLSYILFIFIFILDKHDLKSLINMWTYKHHKYVFKNFKSSIYK